MKLVRYHTVLGGNGEGAPNLAMGVSNNGVENAQDHVNCASTGLSLRRGNVTLRLHAVSMWGIIVIFIVSSGVLSLSIHSILVQLRLSLNKIGYIFTPFILALRTYL